MKSLFATALLLALAACGAPDSTSSIATNDDAGNPSNATVAPGSFRMFVTPGGPGDARCAFYTELSLFQGFQAPVAQLENGLHGTCDVLVDPDRRAFNLGVSVDACNSLHLVSDRLEIVDHRQRTCKDIVSAQVIMKETDEQGFTTTLYSDDVGVTATRTEQGLLRSIQAIGGETTGYGLQLANGSILELDLATNGFESRFVEGVQFEVTGTMTEIKGIEIPVRKVLIVTSMTALQ